MKVYLAVFAVMALVAVCSGFTLRKKSSKFNLFKRQGGPGSEEGCDPVDHAWLENPALKSGLSSEANELLESFVDVLSECEGYVMDVYKSNGHDKNKYGCRYENSDFMSALGSADANAPDYIIQQICPVVVGGAIDFKHMGEDEFAGWLEDSLVYTPVLKCAANRLNGAYLDYEAGNAGKRGIFHRLASRSLRSENCPSDNELMEIFSEDDDEGNNEEVRNQARSLELVSKLKELIELVEQEYM